MLEKAVFDLNLFLGNQKSIWTKYDSLENGLSLKVSEKEFVNNIDRYILHAIEELYEVKDAYDLCVKSSTEVLNMKSNSTMEDLIELNKKVCIFSKDNLFREYIYELIDVTMYCGTILSIIQENLNQYGVNDEIGTIMVSGENKTTDTIMLEVMNQLISLRLPYKKRKWHKSSEELTTGEKISSLITLKSTLINTIKSLLRFIETQLESRNMKLEEACFLIESKQKFVINLKERN